MSILAGVDGSSQSLQAVRAAAMEAKWRDRPLRIVHAFVWPMLHVASGPPQGGPSELGLRHAAEAMLKEAASVAMEANPSVEVSTDLMPGSPVPVLMHAARDAELVVVGDRGLGGFTGLLLGSVAVQLAAHATAPVLIARGNLSPTGPVIVGVDGAPASSSAVEYAFQEASWRIAELVAVHTWTGPVSTGAGDMLPLVYDVDAVAQDEERLLSEAISGYRTQFPDVVVRSVIEHHRAARTLISYSHNAQLVVVGSRGRGGFAGLLLGSVSQQVMHHSHCPVLIARTKA